MKSNILSLSLSLSLSHVPCGVLWCRITIIAQSTPELIIQGFHPKMQLISAMEWEVVISAVRCGIKHMSSLVVAIAAIGCPCCSKLALFEGARWRH